MNKNYSKHNTNCSKLNWTINTHSKRFEPEKTHVFKTETSVLKHEKHC